MKTRLPLFFLSILSLWAADFWQTKPYTEWSDKEAQRLLDGSPWAREVEIPMGGPAAPPGGGSPGGGRGGRGGGGEGDVPIPASLNLVLRWRTALPMKQALVHLKYGKDAASSADAKTILEQQEASYVIEVSGVPAMMMAGPPEPLKNALKSQSALSVKGKGILAPSEVQVMPNNRTVDLYISFPRTPALTLDDKDVEFSTRIGPVAVRYKFRLKDMVFNGKLEL